MSSSLKQIEGDIAETRNRLAGTIGRIQDKLTVSGIVDEVMGSGAVPGFDTAFDKTLDIVRRNPIPVLIVAAGLGFMLNRIARREARARALLVDQTMIDVPVLSTGQARIYDPDRPTAHPSARSLEAVQTAEIKA